MLWQSLLGEAIADPQEKQRLATELGINVTTLDRWVRGQSAPRLHNLLSLVQHISHPAFLPALQEAFPELEERTERARQVSALEEVTVDIPTEFYRQVLSNIATTQMRLRFWSTCQLVLQQALGQLDPQREGLDITIIQCMVPGVDGKIHSVRERVGMRTGRDVEPKTLFLGLESLAGYVVSTGYPVVIQDLEEASNMLVRREDDSEQSAAIAPILQEGRIAGCLLVSSPQTQAFPPARCALIRDYAHLVALAFSPDDFYDWAVIDLRVMPESTVQKAYFATFRERLATLLFDATRQQTPMTREQAESLVWRQLEEAFVELPPDLLHDGAAR